MKYVISASYGNDSIAMIQLAKMLNLDDVTVVYSDTGWAADFWNDRVKAGEEWVKSLGFNAVTIKSEGFSELVRRKKAFPRGGGGKFQFCTVNLKIFPFLDYMDENDHDKKSIVMVGIRREESQNRKNAPFFIESSENHGGRKLWLPLASYTDEERNELINMTPFDALPFRSKECYPCVNARVSEKATLTPEAIKKVSELEHEMGKNSKGNDRVMFSPEKNYGAIGIIEVVNMANKGNCQLDFDECSGGFCGY